MRHSHFFVIPSLQTGLLTSLPASLQASLQTSLQTLLLPTLLLAVLSSVSGTALASGGIVNNSSGFLSSFESDFLPVDQAFVFTDTPADGGLRLTWKVTPGHYLYRERMTFSVIGDNASLGEPDFSIEGERKQDPYFGEVTVFHNDVSVFLPVHFKSGTEATIRAAYQGCADAGLCYPPQTRELLVLNELPASTTPETTESPATGVVSDGALSDTKTLPDTNPDTSKEKAADLSSLDTANGINRFLQHASLATIAGVFFLLGVGLTFTPCVFPMIPIVSSIIAGQTNPTMARSLLLSLSYVFGMAITYSLAGVATGLLGAGANAQAMLQSAPVLIFFAGLFSLLSLAMFGVYELQLPASLRDRLTATSNRFSGGQLGAVFAIGATSALIVSPCVSAPLAGSLVYISTTENALLGGIALFMLGLGMGVPLIAVAVGGGKLLPKAGAWMETIRQVFGFLLLGVAIWLISRLLSDFTVMLLWALLAGTMAVVSGALEPADTTPKRVLKAFSLLLLVYAIILMVGAFTHGSDPLDPLSGIASGEHSQADSEQLNFVTITSSEELATQLEKSARIGKLAMLDVYADWCVSCKIMEREVFHAPGIKQTLADFYLIKADVTRGSPDNIALLKQFDLFGPPSILFFDAHGLEMKTVRVQGEMDRAGFSQLLGRVLQSGQN